MFGFLSCKKALARLDDYLDRELSPREQRQVAAHLKICAKCARHFRFERAFIEDVRAKAAQVQAPPELLIDIRQSLRVLENGAEK